MSNIAETVGNLTLGEWQVIKKNSGIGLGDLSDGAMGDAGFLIALVTVLKKRENNTFKLADAEAMTLPEVTDYLGLSPEDAD